LEYQDTQLQEFLEEIDKLEDQGQQERGEVQRLRDQLQHLQESVHGATAATQTLQMVQTELQGKRQLLIIKN